MAKKLVWIVQGYDKQEQNGDMVNVVQFELYAETEKEALKRAKSFLLKNHYRVKSIIEK